MINFPGELFDMLDYDKASSAEGMTFVPMIGGNGAPDYLLLSEAQETGKFTITEVSEGGSVPWLLAKNMLGTKVLVIDGEEVIGGKQNRIINVTILIPEKSEIKIPVSCVEAHRWSRRSAYFEDSGRFIDYNVKAHKLHEFATKREARTHHRPDQSVIWDAVDMTLEQERVTSETAAAYEAYLKKKDKLNKFLETLEPLKDQVGLAVFLNGKFIGLDYLTPSSKFHKYFAKILSSYMMIPAWLLEKTKKQRKRLEDIKKVLGEPKELTLTDSPAEGKNLYAVWEGFAGHGLVYDSKILHLTVLQTPERRKRRKPIMTDVLY